MDFPETILQIELRMKRERITAHRLCEETGISHATWIAWKHGKRLPLKKTWDHVTAHLERLGCWPLPEDALRR